MLKKNVGQPDRILRLIIGAALIIGFFALSGGLAWASLIVGVIVLFTAITSSCAIYSILGLSTAPAESEDA